MEYYKQDQARLSYIAYYNISNLAYWFTQYNICKLTYWYPVSNSDLYFYSLLRFTGNHALQDMTLMCNLTQRVPVIFCPIPLT